MATRTVQIPASRLPRWIDGFAERHGGSTAALTSGVLKLTGADTAVATLHPAFPIDVRSVDDFIAAAARIPRCAFLAVRRGGFLAAIAEGNEVTTGDAGKRHVQGRTAAGGWSQQRFARRRDKQVHELLDAAISYAVRVILPGLPVEFLATGGDRALVEEALKDQRLRALSALTRGLHLPMTDPRRSTLRELPELLTAVRIDLVDP